MIEIPKFIAYSYKNKQFYKDIIVCPDGWLYYENNNNIEDFYSKNIAIGDVGIDCDLIQLMQKGLIIYSEKIQFISLKNKQNLIKLIKKYNKEYKIKDLYQKSNYEITCILSKILNI